jgi:hypothetical protein
MDLKYIYLCFVLLFELGGGGSSFTGHSPQNKEDGE